MPLRADGFCFLHFVLPAPSIARMTGSLSDQTLNYIPTVGAAGAFAISAGWQRFRVDDEPCRIHPV